MTKNLSFIVIVVITTMWYLSYFSSFGNAGLYVQLPLIIAVFLTASFSYDRGYLFALVAGITMDLYSSQVFGTYTIAMILPVIISYNAFRKLFARKSLYSLLTLTVTSTIMYHMVVWLLTEMYYQLGWRQFTAAALGDYAARVGWQVLIHIGLVILMVAIAALFTRNLRSRFRLNQRV